MSDELLSERAYWKKVLAAFRYAPSKGSCDGGSADASYTDHSFHLG
ncbi:hypothetical protein ACEQPO_02255 [Bacillus sp. SL00103]